MKAQTLGDTSSLEFMRGRRIFEINPDHPIIKDLNVRLKSKNKIRIIQFHCFIDHLGIYFFRPHVRMSPRILKLSGL
jgi:Hsp90 protein